jgi:hypothetical protein
MKAIHVARHETDTSTGAMDLVMKLPHFMVVGIVKLVLWLDKHGWAPQFLVGTDPNHASVFLSNLGSIGLEFGYHHLVNWGTNSFFVVINQKKLRPFFNPDGSYVMKDSLDVSFTIDERLADGFYFAKSLRIAKYMLEHPEVMNEPINKPVPVEL